MKNNTYILVTLALILVSAIRVSAADSVGHIIPYPSHQLISKGQYTLPSQLKWYASTEGQQKVIELWSALSLERFGIKSTITPEKDNANILFDVNKSIKEEGYKIIVTTKDITISASSDEGFFYALQSIDQLLPLDNSSSSQPLSIPCLVIDDAPRFSYRGLMLDVARFFIPKDEVLRILDCMATLKINKLHLHLVDDNGWRLEIDKHPKLTEIGAWRVQRDERFPGRSNPQEGEPTPVGGFYTKADIKEIVDFASSRMIEVIPEIEMPAHTISSLAAYPEFACPVVDQFIGVIPGIGGPNARFIYCAGNDNVFNFLQDVIDEVVEMFPSDYIHLGGDEADKHYWEKCPQCKARMEKEGIKEVEELQSYFMNRMATYVQSKGKQVMGWDELTNSTLPKDVVIFGWQGQGQAALKAAKQGHRFVMTPAKTLYLIRYQGPQWFEPYTYFGNNTLSDVYNYEPIQDSWAPEYKDLLMGIQASLWTEFCSSIEDVEHQLYPRLMALSEVAWTNNANKNWESFLIRLDSFLERLDDKKIIYAKSMYNIDHLVKPNDGKLEVQLSSIRPDLKIRYTLDGTAPNSKSAIYTDLLNIESNTKIKAATFSNGQQKGEILLLDLKFNLATGKKVKSIVSTDYTLSNGVRGSDRHSDFEWAGWYNRDGKFVVDLGSPLDIKEVHLGSITNFSMGVHKPQEISLLVSVDGVNFKLQKTLKFSSKDVFKNSIKVEDISFNNLRTKGRYVKIEFKNPGVCPADHLRAGAPSWVYFDEIIVK